jgi:hypothetical protein
VELALGKVALFDPDRFEGQSALGMDATRLHLATGIHAQVAGLPRPHHSPTEVHDLLDDPSSLRKSAKPKS